MELLTLIIALVKSGLPFPDLKDKDSVANWIGENKEEVGALVAYFANKTNVTEAEDELAEALGSEELVEKIGDGKILEWLKKNLPTLIQLLPLILPLFLDPTPEPTPEPTPDVI